MICLLLLVRGQILDFAKVPIYGMTEEDLDAHLKALLTDNAAEFGYEQQSMLHASGLPSLHKYWFIMDHGLMKEDIKSEKQEFVCDQEINKSNLKEMMALPDPKEVTVKLEDPTLPKVREAAGVLKSCKKVLEASPEGRRGLP